MERESRWAAYCRKHAAAVAERLWMLDEQALSHMLDDIDLQLCEDGVSLRLTKQFYMNLTALVVHELNDRDVKGLAVLSGSLIVADGEEALAAVKDRMAEAAMQIRRSRNIGQRGTVSLAVKYIDETYRKETLSLSEVAERAGISASHLSLLFKGEMGIGFIQYVTKKRMEQAMLLLQDPLCKASEVAYEVGYGDYSHFNKAFKKYCGLSPLEYKKRFGSY
jgi:two-component system response regulator YesN